MQRAISCLDEAIRCRGGANHHRRDKIREGRTLIRMTLASIRSLRATFRHLRPSIR
jgi:hypothetical protein